MDYAGPTEAGQFNLRPRMLICVCARARARTNVERTDGGRGDQGLLNNADSAATDFLPRQRRLFPRRSRISRMRAYATREAVWREDNCSAVKVRQDQKTARDRLLHAKRHSAVVSRSQLSIMRNSFDSDANSHERARPPTSAIVSVCARKGGRASSENRVTTLG
jgi:hypothetical protein